MTEHFATTPFGGGRVSAADFRRREDVERKRNALKQGGNDTGRADKWQLMRALSEARAAFGLSDRTLVVLDALLSFHTPRELDGSQPIVVFPSNAELSLRSRGMADATLRRHIAGLVEAGLILRRDSPNGKRYCRRDDRGQIEDAYGFDLSPLALAANEIYAAADAVREEQRALQKLRVEISIHLRDTGKLIEAGLAEKRTGDWHGFLIELQPLARRLSRQAERSVLERRRDDLVALRARVEKAWLDALDDEEMSGSDAGFERHYQNSNTDHPFEKGSETELKRTAGGKTAGTAERNAGRDGTTSGGSKADREAGGGAGSASGRAEGMTHDIGAETDARRGMDAAANDGAETERGSGYPPSEGAYPATHMDTRPAGESSGAGVPTGTTAAAGGGTGAFRDVSRLGADAASSSLPRSASGPRNILDVSARSAASSVSGAALERQMSAAEGSRSGNGISPRPGAGDASSWPLRAGSASARAAAPETRVAPETKGEPVPLAYLLGVCPTLATYAKDGISGWRDVITTAGLVRSMLGISPDAWRRACEAMGAPAAAATVAAILERAEHIRSPGGYLRALTERAEQGKFSVKPMLAALEGVGGE